MGAVVEARLMEITPWHGAMTISTMAAQGI